MLTSAIALYVVNFLGAGQANRIQGRVHRREGPTPRAVLRLEGRLQMLSDKFNAQRLRTLASRVGLNLSGGSRLPEAEATKAAEAATKSMRSVVAACQFPGSFLAGQSSTCVPFSPEARRIAAMSDRLKREGLHLAIGSCLSDRDYAVARSIFTKGVFLEESHARTMNGPASVLLGLDLLAGLRGFEPGGDWNVPAHWPLLMDSRPIAVRTSRFSVRKLRANMALAETNLRHFWILHDRLHQPVGCDLQIMSVPMTISRTPSGWKVFATGWLPSDELAKGHLMAEPRG
jgi:hypothetical protein